MDGQVWKDVEGGVGGEEREGKEVEEGEGACKWKDRWKVKTAGGRGRREGGK